MKLETVGRVTVGHLGFQVGGQVDDVDGTEGTFLGADTTTDTEALGDEGDLGLGGDLNTKLTRADDGARLFTFLATFLEADRTFELEERCGARLFHIFGGSRTLGLHYNQPSEVSVNVDASTGLAKYAAGYKELTLSLLTIATLNTKIC